MNTPLKTRTIQSANYGLPPFPLPPPRHRLKNPLYVTDDMLQNIFRVTLAVFIFAQTAYHLEVFAQKVYSLEN